MSLFPAYSVEGKDQPEQVQIQGNIFTNFLFTFIFHFLCLLFEPSR